MVIAGLTLSSRCFNGYVERFLSQGKTRLISRSNVSLLCDDVVLVERKERLVTIQLCHIQQLVSRNLVSHEATKIMVSQRMPGE